MSNTQSVTLRLPVKDVEDARKLAEKKGLPYQTYIKMLLHEALHFERNRSSRLDVEEPVQ